MNSTFAPLPDKTDALQPQFVQDYVNFYKTPRGFHPSAVGSSTADSQNGWENSMPLAFMNMPLLSFADEIQVPVLLVHGENAHSRYFSEDAFRENPLWQVWTVF